MGSPDITEKRPNNTFDNSLHGGGRCVRGQDSHHGQGEGEEIFYENSFKLKLKVQCYGSPFFLKNRFGSGYSLHLTKENIFRNIEK